MNERRVKFKITCVVQTVTLIKLYTNHATAFSTLQCTPLLTIRLALRSLKWRQDSEASDRQRYSPVTMVEK